MNDAPMLIPPPTATPNPARTGQLVAFSASATEMVNGAAVTVRVDGTWQKEVPLTGATTTVALSATDNAGNTATQSVTIAK